MRYPMCWTRKAGMQCMLGYRPSEVKKDGNWRKLRVRLIPPGFPELTVHYRQGYYAPSQ